ncbi:hypothetical protein HYY75_06400 [bacterium]|nr:hypothetical protein [bacterium]
MNFLIKLKDIDRRVIFVFVAVSVCLPMLLKLDFMVVPGKNVKSLYDFIEGLPPGTRTFLSFDFDPASMPELHPAAVAVLVHMFRRGLKPICGANWPVGGEMAKTALASATQIFQETQARKKLPDNGEKQKLEKTRDFVNLGYKPGGVVLIKRLVTDFLGPYPTDQDGVPTAGMDIFRNPDGRKFSISDVKLIVSFTAGTGGIEAFINVAGDLKCTMGAACTSVNIPRFYTYLQTKQLIGMTGGLPGAAEYEKLVGHLGPARKGMAPQTIGHLVIIGFIIIGNIAYLAEKSKSSKKHLS